MRIRAVNPNLKRAVQRDVAFTLVELLVVISLIIALAAIALPSLKGLTQSNITGGALQQLADDLSEARLRAINGRGTVYVAFVPPDVTRRSWGNLSPDQRKQLMEAVKGQYSAYIMFARRNLGDQPGAENPRYLSEWRHLPQGIFIATNKLFSIARSEWENWPMNNATNRPFYYMDIPFPTATNAPIPMPTIAFDYRGRLLSSPHDSQAPFRKDFEFIQITQGSIILGRDADNNVLMTPAEIIEQPRGNTTNNPVIQIDPLTGRAQVVAIAGEKP
jgi:hypothetical protein